MNEIEGHRRRPVVRWKDRVKEYMHERVADRGRGIEQTRRESINRERWRLCCDHSTGERGVKRL